MTRRICAVFDIDDTLYLERDYIRSGFEAVSRWIAQWIHIDSFAERCWRSFLLGRRGSIFDDVLRESGKHPTPGLVSALVEIYRAHTPAISLAADAREALQAISAFASIAIVTDGPATSQSRKAEVLNLPSLAAPIILTDILGDEFRKPHVRAFELVRKHSPALAYAYIADNPHKDFKAPKQLGWTTVRVRRPGSLQFAAESIQPLPDHEAPDCSGLAAYLAQL